MCHRLDPGLVRRRQPRGCRLQRREGPLPPVGAIGPRLERARQLQEERARRDQACDLLDCLQLGDKAQALLQDSRQLEAFGFTSRRAAKQVIKEFESLRNNLAHAQDIVTYDWPQIARMARNLQNNALEE